MKLLKFGATWCDPCKMLSKTMEGMELGLPVENLDIDEYQVLARTYSVRGVPTVILVDATGKEDKRFSGVQSKSWIKSWLGDIYK